MKVFVFIFISAFFLLSYDIFPMQTKTVNQQRPPAVRAAQQNPLGNARPAGVPQDLWDNITQRVESVHESANRSVQQMNRALALAHNSNTAAATAHRQAGDALRIAQQVTGEIQEANRVLQDLREIRDDMYEVERRFTTRISDGCDRIRESSAREEARIERVRDETIQRLMSAYGAGNADAQIAKINEMQRLGIFEQQEKIRAQGLVDTEKTRWSAIKQMATDPVFIAKMMIAVAGLSLAVYGVRYLVQYWVDRFRLPRVISQTSRCHWLWDAKNPEAEKIEDLIFEPQLQKQLFDLSLRVKNAQELREILPNVLFYGPSGTGKTAFAKALAQNSGLDYALTSGSEFAKITDLNLAGNELRNLLQWANRSDKGLLIFIDEAESLFADKNFIKMSKTAVDFINIFLSLVSDQSQKKVMFVFATNYPFKIDDAILNRVGISIEFVLPQEEERAQIFCEYLAHYAHEPEKTVVNFDEETIETLVKSIKKASGLTPREIKFLAQEIVFSTRQQQAGILGFDEAKNVFDVLRYQSLQREAWKKERSEWVSALGTVAV